MYDCHANAWCIRPGKVLGRQLQHFTVGHSFILTFTKNAFVCGGEMTTADLIMGVLLCSVPFEKAIALVMDKPEKLARQASWLGLWHKIRDGKTLDQHKQDFLQYINTYSQHPDVWKKPEPEGKEGHDSAMPAMGKIAWCMIKAGIPEREAWGMPLPRAMMYYCIEAEWNGQEFVNEKEVKAIEELP